jgi:MerR family transcriptional regulator, redox-sensitive transcriptional activator SoxR
MKIGELAKRTGLNASAIRYYETRGLLLAPYRAGGQRRYSDEAVYRVRLISFASAMGFALGEIKIFLSGLRDDAPVGPRWKRLARRKIEEVTRNIERELRLKSLLEHMLRCRCTSLRVCVERLSPSEDLRRAAKDESTRSGARIGVNSRVTPNSKGESGCKSATK